MHNKILIVEDEESIREMLTAYFVEAKYDVSSAENGLDALQLFHAENPDVVVLDRMLPDITGDQVCEEIRKISEVPILMLTAKSDEEARLEGFEMGADDYVTKPFSPREVVARIRALIKRSIQSVKEKQYRDDYLHIDFETKVARVEGKDIHLTANEMEIVEALFVNRPRPLTRSQIVEIVFGYNYEAYERNMDTYIKNIRHKLEKLSKQPEYICTKYGVGYYFGK